MALALTNLTFTVDSGTNYNDTYYERGDVSIPHLSCYHASRGAGDCPSGAGQIQTLAHAYGETSLAAQWGTYNEPSDVLSSKFNYAYYWRQIPNRRQFAYRFNEYNPNDNQSVYPRMTDRFITAESGECTEFSNITKDDKVPQNFTYSNGKITGWVEIPPAYLGRDGTTYIYKGFHDPVHAHSPEIDCGPRCIIMFAYKNPSGSPEPHAFYRCPISISEVQYGDHKSLRRPEHLVPDGVAKVAAASIALQGRWTAPPNDPIPKDEDKRNFRQFQYYASK